MGFPPSPVVYNEAIQEDFFLLFPFWMISQSSIAMPEMANVRVCVYVLAIVTYSTL